MEDLKSGADMDKMWIVGIGYTEQIDEFPYRGLHVVTVDNECFFYVHSFTISNVMVIEETSSIINNDQG